MTKDLCNQSIPVEINELINRGALFCVSLSGGKDSQAMFNFIHQLVPKDRILVIHAVLPEVDWDGVEEHIHKTTMGVKVVTCRAKRTLLEMINDRGMFPSPKYRQCTSDLKRQPIEKVIRATGEKLIVSCMGMRAEESASRSKLATLKLNKKNSKAGREWYDWLPIHSWLLEDVFNNIKAANQEPHWAYAKGMSRLSCCFCIMANKKDLTTAAMLKPELYKKYVDLEKKIGQVMIMPSKKHGRLGLEDITGIRVS